MTVTYNFDDFIEQCFLESRREGESTRRGFESVTNPWSQFRRTEAVIYHANGVLPQNPLETPSDRFVFSEASFAEQLMGIFAGDQTALLNHFSKNTCLLIGLSLEDETLRNILIQSAKACPGNFHYYVHHLMPDECLDPEKQRAIKLANFKVYNLITLFLTDEGIMTLGELIDVEKCPSNQFCDFACVYDIPVQFRFYITGPMGVGKTTTVNLLRSLYVLDEWLAERPYVLAKDFLGLPKEEKEEADSWIISQFQQKNDILRNEHEGIFILDRGTLDPVSFTPDEEWPAKAERILTTLCPGQCQWEVEDGRVILLSEDGKELALRMVITQRKSYTAEKLEKNEHNLGIVYGTTGVIHFDTRGLSPYDVARRIAEIVHLEDYRPICNLHKRLELIMKDGINAAQ
jgi:broad-specificity NMP kinase